MAARDQLRDQVDHLRYVLGRVRVQCRATDVDLGRVVHERRGVVRGDLRGRFVLQASRDEHLVLAAIERVVCEVTNIGDVHHLFGLVAEIFEAPAQEVRQHEGAQVSHVDVAVHGRSAGIDPHDSFTHRLKVLLGAGEGVVDPEALRGRPHVVSMLASSEGDSISGCFSPGT